MFGDFRRDEKRDDNKGVKANEPQPVVEHI